MPLSQNTCTQCGQCCRNDGPLLHIDDVVLLKDGQLSLTHLLTLRAGELVHDPVQGRVLALETEVVKLAGTGERQFPWHCVLHSSVGCALHPLRPAQCAALYCTDTKALQAMYHTERLTRSHVFAALPALFQGHGQALVEAHEAECSISSWADVLKNTQNAPVDSAVQKDIIQKIRYDISFREACIEKGGVHAKELIFLLGRPLLTVVQSFGYTVRRNHMGQEYLANK